jgi:DNA-binding Lrp family transcriptional regulator
MSQPELLLMSQRERDHLKVLHEVRKGQLSQKQAAAQLGLTDRWVRKLLKRLRKEGDRGIVHRLRGRTSNRKLPEPLREKAVKRRFSRARPSLHQTEWAL